MPVPVSLGLLIMSLHPKRQRLGDLVAGTLVVRTTREQSDREPWMGTLWSTLESHELALSLGQMTRLSQSDLVYLRRVITRRLLDNREREALLQRVALHYCARLAVPLTATARNALREIYLCLREALQSQVPER